MSNFQMMKVHGQVHVLKKLRRTTPHFVRDGEKVETVPDPNYLNTGLCLCGILKPRQTLGDFIAVYKKKGR